MGPRANFECRKCQATYTDLPVASTRCPVCGFKRGFRRLFDAVQVSTTGHRIATVLDPMMRPQLEQRDTLRAETAASDKALSENYARHMEVGTPAQRQALATAAPQGPVRWMAPQMAGGMINPAAGHASREYNWPHVRRRVVPTLA